MSRSTRNVDIVGRSASSSPVRASRITKSASSAWLMKCLVPLIVQPSPSAYGAGTDGAHVRACAGFGHGQAVDALAADAGEEVRSRWAGVPASRMFEGRTTPV